LRHFFAKETVTVPNRKGIVKVSAIVLTLMGFSGAANCQKTAVLFQHVRVFDGATLIPDTNVLIKDGRIQDVGPDVTDAQAQVVDGAGKTLLPGLIDAHTHIWGEQALERAVIFGVTTELDMFMPVPLMARLKGHTGETMADFLSAGTLATAPGGHGTEYGFDIPTITHPKEAQVWVDARIREGSDYIKIVYTAGGGWFPSISKEMLQALVAAAHQRNRLAVVHIGTLQQAREAIEAGADGLVHLFLGPFSDGDFGRFVAAHHAFVIPTLTVLHSSCGPWPPGLRVISDPDLAPFLTPVNVEALRRTFPRFNTVSCDGAMWAVKQLKAIGVPILAGTDVPNPGTIQGASLHEELQFLVEAGLTPLEALASATCVPAKVFHLADRGRISPGMRADLVLVKGNPAEDILATRRILAVYKEAFQSDREKYRAKTEQDRNQAAQ
jgi:imidazolonepropionase-like amidohydrolase